MVLEITIASNLIEKEVPEDKRAVPVTPTVNKSKQAMDRDAVNMFMSLKRTISESEKKMLQNAILEDEPILKRGKDSYAWEKDAREQANLCIVDWKTSRAFFKSPNTMEYKLQKSYNVVSSFCRSFNRMICGGDSNKSSKQVGETGIYLPNEGMLFAKDCHEYYEKMQTLWPKWYEEYDPEGFSKEELDTQNLNNIIVMGQPTVENEIWEVPFFLQLAYIFYHGRQSGVVQLG